MIISLNTALDLKIFSPSEPIGIFIILVGLIFTGMIFYIIYAVSTNKESLEDKKIRNKNFEPIFKGISKVEYKDISGFVKSNNLKYPLEKGLKLI